MKKPILFLFLFFLLLTGCGKKAENNEETVIPTYYRNTVKIPLSEDYNPYSMEFLKDGVMYYELSYEAVEDSEEEYNSVYEFFFQSYDGEALEQSVFSVENEYIKGFKALNNNGTQSFFCLLLSKVPHITKFSKEGEILSDIELPDSLFGVEDFPKFLPTLEGSFYIQNGNRLFRFNGEGKEEFSIDTEGYADKLFSDDCGNVYLLSEISDNKGIKTIVYEVDTEKRKLTEIRSFEGKLLYLDYYLDNRFIYVTENRIVSFDSNEKNDEVLVDLIKQDIMPSLIKSLSFYEDNISIISFDQDDKDFGACKYVLSTTPFTESIKETQNKEEDYTEDGRRIIRVAVPKDYQYSIEFHAKKYNQKNNKSFVKIDRFEGELSEYLGKGNRPDIAMLSDSTEVEPLAKRKLLADLSPLFLKSENYSVDMLVPSITKALSVDDKLVSMGSFFSLLLRVSDGTDFSKEGYCTTEEYLEWYDNYLTNLSIEGRGSLDYVFFADVPYFISKETNRFETEDFSKVLESYKKLIEHHGKEFETTPSLKDYGYLKQSILYGPIIYSGWGYAGELSTEGAQIVGMPLPNGERTVIMMVPNPLVIMDTSECKDEAFDFVMYYSSLEEHLFYLNSEGDYGKSYCTPALFSVFSEVLRKNIYETEAPYNIVRVDEPDRLFREYHFTEKDIQLTKDLIDSSVIETKEQNVIYDIIMEEIEPYLSGSKTLEETVEIIKKRADLFLAEGE